MVHNMTPDEYERIFGRPSQTAPKPSDNGDNGSAPIKEAGEFIGDEPEALTDEELELIAEQTVEGYATKFIREDWQTQDIIHLLRYHDKRPEAVGSANWSEMGCLSGDDSLTVLCGSSIRYWSIREAYYGFNRLNRDKRKNWKSEKPYYTHAFVDGRIRHHKIEGISFTGIKPTLKLTFSDGRSVRLTHDHLMLRPDGSWVEAQQVTVGDQLIVRGHKGEKHNSKRTVYPTVRVPGAIHGAGATRDYVTIHRVAAGTPEGMHTHHIDETSENYDPENLQVMTLEEHSRIHARDQIASYDAPPMQVVRIEEAGETDVYDLHMETPYHNFVASGVVVHNCYKTSTGLWLTERLVDEARVRNTLPGPKLAHKQPSILIITTKGGKGTFLEAIPEILPEFTILNVETQALFYYKNGHMLKLDKELKYVPPEFAMPTICIAHYNIFARTNFGVFEVDPETKLPLQIDGAFVFKPWNQADYIINREWDVVWCDEFHRMKDRTSKWTVNIKKIRATVAKHGSTGTGFINRPNEIWSLLNWLDPQTYGSYWAFEDEYCQTDDWDGYKKVTGVLPEKLDEFRQLVRDIGTRRTLSQVRPDIKLPLFKPVTVELNPTQRKMYDQIKMELAAEDQKGTPLYAANVLSMLQRLRQICVGTPEVIEEYPDPVTGRMVQKIKLTEPSSKIDALMDILEELQWDDELKEPLVVFSNFRDPLDLFKARLDKHNQGVIDMDLDMDQFGYKYIHLDVGDSDLVRYRKWHDEFPKLEHRIFMSTLQLGGESINLTPAHHVVYLDRSWSPKDNAQGIGRLRRPGQTGQPVVIHINALHTTDQYIEHVNEVKHGWFKQIFHGEDEM